MNKNLKQFVFLIGLLIMIAFGFIALAKNQNMITIKEGNLNKTPYELELGKYQDSDCGMVIDDFSYVSQVIAPDGKTWFFHDHGGMAHWLLNKDFKENAVIWVMSKDTKKYIDGRKAWYSRTDLTPMEYGFGAYEIKQNGFVSFTEMVLLMARGEHLGNPQIKAELLKGKE